MRDVLPREVLQQPKAGFAAPVDYWLANDLRDMVDDLLSESQIRARGLFNPRVVQNFIEEQRCGVQDWSSQIWQFLTLELWMKMFLDGDSRQMATDAIHAHQTATA
jgi:asparagine synthase (glutamine-hydrolysing)